VSDCAVNPWLLLFDPESDETRRVHATVGADATPKREKRLFCVSCRTLITNQDERITIQGAHEHTCANPHGLTFHIGCFRSARGCVHFGDATAEHTWFKGYSWRIALCAQCQAHLGWVFESPTGGFYGLILDRLTSHSGNNN
jgi:hypothetical protein